MDFTCFTFQLFHDLDQSQHSEDPQFLLQYYLNFNQSWQEHGGLSRQWWKFPCENAVKGFYRGNVSLQACYRNSPTAPARNNPRICLCCLLIGFKLHFHLNIFLAVMTRLSDGNISVRYSCYGQWMRNTGWDTLWLQNTCEAGLLWCRCEVLHTPQNLLLV